MTWRDLDRSTKSEVYRLATLGRAYPDRDVRLLAVEWASKRLKMALWKELGLLVGAAVLGAAFVYLCLSRLAVGGLGAVPGLSAVLGVVLGDVLIRRQASKVLAANQAKGCRDKRGVGHAGA